MIKYFKKFNFIRGQTNHVDMGTQNVHITNKVKVKPLHVHHIVKAKTSGG